MSDLEVRWYTNNDHWLCTCHLSSYSIFTREVCYSSFIDRDKYRCQGGKESEKGWQNWGPDTGLTDSTAQGPSLTINYLLKIWMCQFSLVSMIPLWPWMTRAEGPPRNPTSGSASNRSPRTAAASQWLLWAIYETVPALRRRPSADYSSPPVKQNQHTLSFERQALFQVLQSAASLSTPSLTVRAATWAEPARHWMLPFVSGALGWRSRLESLNNNDESEYLFLRFFSKLPLHQLLNSSIQAATDTSRSLLAWGSQWGKLGLPGNKCDSSITPSLKKRHKPNFSKTRRRPTCYNWFLNYFQTPQDAWAMVDFYF